MFLILKFCVAKIFRILSSYVVNLSFTFNCFLLATSTVTSKNKSGLQTGQIYKVEPLLFFSLSLSPSLSFFWGGTSLKHKSRYLILEEIGLLTSRQLYTVDHNIFGQQQSQKMAPCVTDYTMYD